MVVICKLSNVFEGMHPPFSAFRDLSGISSLVVIKRPQKLHGVFLPELVGAHTSPLYSLLL